MRNSIKCTYIVTMFLGQMIMLAGAVAIPVWVTPGSYWWTAILLLFAMCDGHMIGKRMDLWTGKP